MNVLYFTSDAFTSVAAVSIVSLFENNKDATEINVYIIDDGISDSNRNLLDNMVEKYHRRVYYIPAPDPSEFFHFPFKSRYQMGHSYMRMCIGSLLPESIEKVLCLDSDTLVSGNIRELWEMEIDDNILAGVADCVNVKAFKHQFMLGEEDIYCNAGMFLVNLKSWRNNRIEEKISKTIIEHNGNIFFFEQTLMNYVCKGKIVRVEAKYNSYTLFYALTYKNLICWRRPTNFYTEEEIDEAKHDARIIHFTRNFYMTSRPWVENCDHPLTEMYMNYKRLTPWPNQDVDRRPFGKLIRYKLIHFIPQSMLVYIVNVMYNEIRPLMRWKNE